MYRLFKWNSFDRTFSKACNCRKIYRRLTNKNFGNLKNYRNKIFG